MLYEEEMMRSDVIFAYTLSSCMATFVENMLCFTVVVHWHITNHTQSLLHVQCLARRFVLNVRLWMEGSR